MDERPRIEHIRPRRPCDRDAETPGRSTPNGGGLGGRTAADDRGQVLEALQARDRPRARDQHRRPRPGLRGGDREDGLVHVEYTLTTMGCPIGPLIEHQMQSFLTGVPGVDRGGGRDGPAAAVDPRDDVRGGQGRPRLLLTRGPRWRCRVPLTLATEVQTCTCKSERGVGIRDPNTVPGLVGGDDPVPPVLSGTRAAPPGARPSLGGSPEIRTISETGGRDARPFRVSGRTRGGATMAEIRQSRRAGRHRLAGRAPRRPGIRVIEVDEDTTAYEKGHIPGAVGWNWTTDLHTEVGRDYVDQAGLSRAALGRPAWARTPRWCCTGATTTGSPRTPTGS